MIILLSIGYGKLGRFGNQLFTIAGVIGIACRNGQPFGFPEWINQDNALFGDHPDKMSQFFVNPLPDLNGIPEAYFKKIDYFWGYKDLHLPDGNWDIFSHLQSEKYFKDYMPLIRAYFRMKDEPEQNDYVAIHYRAGDYQEGDDVHHPRCKKEYYDEAMKMFPNEKFMVFSDSIEEFEKLMGINVIGADDKKFFYTGYDKFRMPSCNYIKDFRLMKRCKSFITANSSFSLMAAILGEHPDKKIVCPKRWFGKAMPEMYHTRDIYPENAIVI